MVPNLGREALHLSVGFEPIGIHERVVFKFGQRLDLCFMQEELPPRQSPRLEKPGSFLELQQVGELTDLLGP